MNRFRFNNVGQGLFYSGSLDDGAFNFVYDCGSESSNPNFYLQNTINNLSFNRLDLLVVSHFHADHTNGIPLLRQRFQNSNPTIVLPYFPISFQFDPNNLFVRSFLIVQGYESNGINDIIGQIRDSNESWIPIDSNHDNEEANFQYRSYQPESCNNWVFKLINKCVSTNMIQQVVNEIVDLLDGERLENI